MFNTQVGTDASDLGVKVVANGGGGFIYRTQGAEQRGLVVKRFASIGDEDGGDAQGVVDDKYGRRSVPCRISAGFEGVADATVGETGGVGFLLDEHLAGKFLHHAAFAVVLQKTLVLLGGASREGLKPVGVVRHTHLCCPSSHSLGHAVGDTSVEGRPFLNDRDKCIVRFPCQVAKHLLAVEDMLGIQAVHSLFGRCGRDWPLGVRPLYCAKSSR